MAPETKYRAVVEYTAQSDAEAFTVADQLVESAIDLRIGSVVELHEVQHSSVYWPKVERPKEEAR